MGRYLLGLILILLGVGFLLDQTNIIVFNDIIRVYWPSIIILFGISGLFEKKSGKLGNLIVILVGVLLQLNKLGYLSYDAFKLFWPIVLILIGINILFSKGVRTHNVNVSFNDDDNSAKSEKKWSKNITLEDTLDSFVIFAGLETNNQSQQFKGGKATALFGGIDLDLRGAKLHENVGMIELNAIFGGIDLKVPSDWRVEVSGVPVFGGWSNKTRPNPDPNAPLLRIKCFTMFGGADIK